MGVAAALLFTSVTFTGCERKEKIIDVKTPTKRIEVERSKDTGKVNVDIESRSRTRTEVETPNAKVQVERSKGDAKRKSVNTAIRLSIACLSVNSMSTTCPPA